MSEHSLTYSARVSRATPLPPAARREAILDAVLPLVLDRGRALSTKQIAEASGIAEGTIFRVFADKGELLEAVVEAAVDPAPTEAALRAIDPELVKTAVSGPRFQQCFFENCQDKEIEAFVRQIVG